LFPDRDAVKTAFPSDTWERENERSDTWERENERSDTWEREIVLVSPSISPV